MPGAELSKNKAMLVGKRIVSAETKHIGALYNAALQKHTPI